MHLIALVAGVHIGTYLTLILFFIASLTIFLKIKTTESIEYAISPIHLLFLLVLSCTYILLYLGYLLHFDTYDPSIYKLIGILAKQKIYPPLSPEGPDTPLMYHYGVALFASALKIFSNIEPWNAVIPIQLIFLSIFPISIFSFLFSFTRNCSQCFLGTIIGCSCANLLSLKLISIFTTFNYQDFFQNIHQKLVFMNDGGFAISTSKALISPNTTVALPLSLALFYFFSNEKCFSKSKRFWISILFISAFLFFAYEAFWLPVIVSLVLYQAIKMTLNKEKIVELKVMCILIFIFLISPLLVGGVLTTTKENMSNLIYFNPKLYTFSWIGFLNDLYPAEWIIKQEVIDQAKGLRFYKIPLISKYFIYEFGLPLVFLPVVTIWLVPKKNVIAFFFLLSGIISFTIPFLINYIPCEIEPTRFFTYARFVFSTLFGAFLGWTLSIKLHRVLFVIHRLIFIVIVIILLLPGIVWLLPTKYGSYDYRYGKIPLIDKKALVWLSKHACKNDRGIGPMNVPHIHFELINIAGVYGVGGTVQRLLDEETRNTALITLNPCLLKELKVRWVYLNQDMLLKIPQSKLKQLIEENTLILRYKLKSKDKIRIIYEFNPTSNQYMCYEKDYRWAIGKINDSKFIPLKTFLKKEIALKKLKKIKELLPLKKAYLYTVEAIKI